MPEALQPGTRPCVCSAGKVPVLLLDLLPNVFSKASSIAVVLVLLALGLKPGKMRLNKGLYTAYIALDAPKALLQLLNSAQTFEVL